MSRQRTYVGVYAPITMERQVLLVHKGGGPYKGSWDLPGGGIQFGEAPEAALRRELLEETGFTIEEASLRTVLTYRVEYQANDGETEDFHHIGLIYSVEGLKPGSVPASEEEENAAWFPEMEVACLRLTPFASDVLV
jgi:8-oxo-dGTP diphosphatase